MLKTILGVVLAFLLIVIAIAVIEGSRNYGDCISDATGEYIC